MTNATDLLATKHMCGSLMGIRMTTPASSTGNVTTCLKDSSVLQAISVVYFIIVIALGTFGNGLLLCIFISCRSLCKKSINYLICANTVANFLVSVLFDPIIAATSSVPCLVTRRALFMLRLTSDFALEVCVVSSIYTLTAVAANQYLLISRPNTTYRRCCTGRKAVSTVLAAIWILALVVVMMFWFVERSLIKLAENNQDGHTAIEISFVLPCILNYCPLIVIPCFQWGTVRAIKASRERIENKMAPNRSTVSSVVPSVTASSPSNGQRLPLDVAMNENVEHLPAADGFDLDDNKKIQRRGKTELRTLKTMMVMYIILVVSWTPSLLAWANVSVGSKLNKVLELFGSFLSVYPALIPFAFMWTNKNYSNVIRKKWAKIRPHGH